MTVRRNARNCLEVIVRLVHDRQRFRLPVIAFVGTIYLCRVIIKLSSRRRVLPSGIVVGEAGGLLTLQLQLLLLLVPTCCLYLFDEGHLGLFGHGPRVTLLSGAQHADHRAAT